jgi:hypothetical protein
MGGQGQERAIVTPAAGASIIGRVRVASKPAFALLVGAAAFLIQDIFVRVTKIPITVDEGIGFVTLFSWLAYWAVPVSLQDAAPAAPAEPVVAPGPAA